MKKRSFAIAITALTLGLCLSLAGCDSSDSTKTKEASTPADLYVERLTKEVTFSGVTFNVDPSWTDKNSRETTLRYDVSSSGVIAVETFLKGETKDLVTFEKKVGGLGGAAKDYELVKEWKEGDTSYKVYSYTDSFGTINTHLLGYSEDGKGFKIFFNRGTSSSTTILSDAVLEAIFETVKFSPKDVTIDSNQKTQSEQSSSSSSSTSSKSSASVPAEYKSALTKAQQYSDMMYMSKVGLYDQLTSEYGEKFSAEAAQYAIDNVKADWNANALKKARDYQDKMAMSPSAIHDQLTSAYGEQFTQEEADYAITNL